MATVAWEGKDSAVAYFAHIADCDISDQINQMDNEGIIRELKCPASAISLVARQAPTFLRRQNAGARNDTRAGATAFGAWAELVANSADGHEQRRAFGEQVGQR